MLTLLRGKKSSVGATDDDGDDDSPLVMCSVIREEVMKVGLDVAYFHSNTHDKQ